MVYLVFDSTYHPGFLLNIVLLLPRLHDVLSCQLFENSSIKRNMADKIGPEPTDSQTLARLGKQQVLKRRFGFLSIFGFAIAELITWETVLVLFAQPFYNGGPAAAIYGYIIAAIATLSVYTVISELASMAPISGGQYYWVYMMAPVRWKVASSYLVGWLTSLAWIATIATESIYIGTIIEGLIILENPDFVPQRWQGTLLAWAMVAVAIFINVIIPRILPKFEISILVFHLAGFVAITATLLAMTPKGSTASVFETVLNEGGWPTQGLSYCVGFIGNVATFVGADASVHMAEEIENAAINLPRAIFTAMGVNSLLGFSMMLTILFCLGDVKSVLETRTGFPFIQIYYNSTKSLAGTAAMTAIGIALTTACSVGITTTASRMVWSFARDHGLPLSRFLSRVSKRTQVPVASTLIVCGFACAMALIYIGSTTAFNDVLSLTITAFYGSYLLPSLFLLYHRIKGHVLPHGTVIEVADTADTSHIPATNEENAPPTPNADKIEELPRETSVTDTPITTINTQALGQTSYPMAVDVPLIWGPWRVPGVLGIINNAIACMYMVFVIFWSFWPPVTPVDYTTMNYSVVVTGGALILAAAWYFVRARKEYKGPLIDTDVAVVLHITTTSTV